MIKYEVLYKKIGFRKVLHLIEPIVVDGKEFTFPRNSILFWYKTSDVPVSISKDYGYLANLKKPYINTRMEIKGDTLGSLRHLSIPSTKQIKNLKEHEKSFKFLKPDVKKISLSSNTLLVYNYGNLNYNYRYSPNPLNNYYKWYNSFLTMVVDANSVNSGSNRIKFITIDLPAAIPAKNEIEHFLININKGSLDTLINYKYFNLLEIFRFLSLKHREKSLLYKNIPIEEWENVNFMFTYNGNITLVNMKMLGTLLKDSGVESKIKSYKEETVIKIMIIFFNKILEEVGHSLAEVDDGKVKSNTSNIVDVIKDDTDVQNVVNLDDVIKNELVHKTDVEDADDTDIISDTISKVDTDAVLADTTNDKVLTDEEIMYSKDGDAQEKILGDIHALKDNKLVTKNEFDKVSSIIKNQDKMPSPFKEDKKTLKEARTYTSDEIKINSKDTALPDNAVVLDKTMNFDSLGTLDKKYLKDTYKKDLINTVYSLQKASVVIEDYEVTENKNVLGGIQTHTMKIKPLNGSASTIKVNLPIIDKDGSFKLSGNKYRMRKQKSDNPIRKISNTKVGLTSYYGKLFITKASYKKDDYGFWFQKQLLNKYEEDPKLKDIVSIPVVNIDCKIPKRYGQISRYVKEFRYGNKLFYFEYKTRHKIIKDMDIKKIEKNGVVLVGIEGKTPIVMSDDNRLFTYTNGVYTEIDDIVTMLHFDKSKAPIEFISGKIFKENIPVGILLSYYLGFDNLLKFLKVKYETYPSGKREPVGDNQFVIRFKDKKYYITKDDGKNDLILAGIATKAKIIKDIESSAMNKRDSFGVVFTALGLPLLYSNEIKMLETMFIDPITKQILEYGKEPTTFRGVLVKSAEILVDDNYKHPNDLNNMVLKGYERIAGMMYKELIISLRTNNNKSFFGKSKIELNPYSVINKITEDSTVVLVDDLNPMASLKQKYDVTYLGANGRTEETMNKASREVHPSEIGVVSEGAKDSGAVGISALLSANPKIASTRGEKGDYDIKKDGWSSTLSSSGLMAPFEINDDVKRLNFGLTI